MYTNSHPYRSSARLVTAALLFLVASPTFIHAQTTMWNGSVSSDWHDPANWSNGVPDSTSSVIVSKGAPNDLDILIDQPVGGDTARTGSLTLQSAGRIRLDPEPNAGALIVHGKTQILNGGGIFVRSGRVVFRDDVRVNNGGVLNCGSGFVEFTGRKFEVANGGIFIVDGSTLTTEGPSSTTIEGDLQVATLKVKNRDTLYVVNNLHVVEQLDIESGRTLMVKTGGLLTVDGAVTGGGTIVYESSLPVQLSAFTAVAGASGITLTWSTATEVDNAGWEVERRSVSRQSTVVSRQTEANGWMKLGFVEGAGTSTSPHAYVFTDDISQSTIRNPQSRFAYRLKQLDRSGSFSYSHEAEVELTIPGTTALYPNFPNPFNPATTFSFTASIDGEATLAVHDLTGRLVAMVFRGPVITGRPMQATWNAHGVASGVYVASLRIGSAVASRRIVLAR